MFGLAVTEHPRLSDSITLVESPCLAVFLSCITPLTSLIECRNPFDTLREIQAVSWSCIYVDLEARPLSRHTFAQAPDLVSRTISPHMFLELCYLAVI